MGARGNTFNVYVAYLWSSEEAIFNSVYYYTPETRAVTKTSAYTRALARAPYIYSRPRKLTHVRYYIF